MVPPAGTGVAGVNTRTGLTEAPATPPEVIDVKTIEVLAAVAAGVEVAVKNVTVLAMEATEPKK